MNQFNITKLELDADNCDGCLDNLTSIVCHRGPARFGHWVNYYRIQNKWYLSDDSRYVRLVNGNALIGIGVNETVDLMWFKTC